MTLKALPSSFGDPIEASRISKPLSDSIIDQDSVIDFINSSNVQ